MKIQVGKSILWLVGCWFIYLALFLLANFYFVLLTLAQNYLPIPLVMLIVAYLLVIAYLVVVAYLLIYTTMDLLVLYRTGKRTNRKFIGFELSEGEE